MDLHTFTDIHTHVPGITGSILSVSPQAVDAIVVHNASLPLQQRQYYSLQLHPWHARTEAEPFADTALRLADDPQFVAIGECGLDSLCDTPIDLQRQAFADALLVARRLHKPIIVHCVRLWAEMIHDVHDVFPELRQQRSDDIPWLIIIHGYRRGPQLAKQLLDAGFALSLGTKYHPEVAKMVPSARCYHETDQE